MATLSLRMPENASTVRSGIAKSMEKETHQSDEISAFLPPMRKLYGGSDLQRSISEGNDTTPGTPASPEVAPIIRLNSASAPTPRKIQILQQWEGVVSEVGSSGFTAELRNLTVSDSAPEVAEFPYSEISDADKSLVAPGAVFYWSIGYDTTPGGQVRRVSEIRLRRSPEWTERKLEVVAAEAEQWYKQLTEDAETAPKG